MRAVGLDLSLRATGICVLDGEPGADPDFRTLLLAQPKAKGVEEVTDRLISIVGSVMDVVAEKKPDVVVIEAPAMNQQWQAAAIGELHGVVKVQLKLAFGIIPLLIQATQLRKSVVGLITKELEEYTDKKKKKRRRWSYGSVLGKSGRMRKATVKDAVESKLRELGLEFPNQDEMDAYVAARYGWNKIAPSECLEDEPEYSEDKGPQSGLD